jgi:lipopolysaccharide export system permease protein
MPVLIRYCLMAVWPPFLLSTGLALFILNLLFYLRTFLDYVFVYQASLTNCSMLLLYIQPSFLILAIPIGFLTALLVVYGRLSSDREMVAIEACGFPVTIIVWPMIGFSVLMSLFLVFFMDRILPWGNTSFVKLDYKVVSERTAILVRERVFIQDFEGYVLYVGEKDDRHDLLKNVVVEFLNDKKYPYRLILAKNGTMHQDPKNYHALLDLNDGTMQQLGEGKAEKPSDFFQMQFKNCVLDLSANKIPSGPVIFADSRNITIKELSERIKEEKKENKDTRRDESEFHKKFSIPFSALAFAFIGIPLGLISRGGSYAGPFFSVILVAVYWIFINSGDQLGPIGVLPPFLAMWLPNFVLVAVGLLLLYWLNHRNHFWGFLRGVGKAAESSSVGSPREMVSHSK